MRVARCASLGAGCVSSTGGEITVGVRITNQAWGNEESVLIGVMAVLLTMTNEMILYTLIKQRAAASSAIRARGGRRSRTPSPDGRAGAEPDSPESDSR
eukprot:COSAG01_NODE_994_length_12252_cov_10.271044_7_plen_99_part_00